MGDIMNQSKSLENNYQSRIRKGTLRLARWTGAWLLATALLAFGPRLLWDQAMAFTLLALGLNLGVGIGMILANRNYLAELDELQRKVQLNAMGITLGVAVIAGVPYSMLDAHADISHLLILMSLTFLVSILYGTQRYR
jgi:hypothetical protein